MPTFDVGLRRSFAALDTETTWRGKAQLIESGQKKTQRSVSNNKTGKAMTYLKLL
jgi:hypothetical protein